jgi:hypothetical protein
MQHARGPNHLIVTANRGGYLRLAAELLIASVAPCREKDGLIDNTWEELAAIHSRDEPHSVVPAVFFRRDDWPIPQKASPTTTWGDCCGVISCLVALVFLAGACIGWYQILFGA